MRRRSLRKETMSRNAVRISYSVILFLLTAMALVWKGHLSGDRLTGDRSYF